MIGLVVAVTLDCNQNWLWVTRHQTAVSTGVSRVFRTAPTAHPFAKPEAVENKKSKEDNPLGRLLPGSTPISPWRDRRSSFLRK
jgi:hypothetical protein